MPTLSAWTAPGLPFACQSGRCTPIILSSQPRQAVAVAPGRAAATTCVPKSSPALSGTLQSFAAHFVGHFDNHAQVEYERTRGLSPREGGGHEHIHCVLSPVSIPDCGGGKHLLASYYFNGEPTAVFRQRLYELDAVERDPQFGSCLRMKIFRMRPEVEQQLAAGVSPADLSLRASDDLGEALHVAEADVFWRWCGERFEGAMRTDSIEIISERSGRKITVRDDVALWADALWVNDRGSDTETGAYVYGNIHNIPYKMQRVDESHWTATGTPGDDARATM